MILSRCTGGLDAKHFLWAICVASFGIIAQTARSARDPEMDAASRLTRRVGWLSRCALQSTMATLAGLELITTHACCTGELDLLPILMILCCVTSDCTVSCAQGGFQSVAVCSRGWLCRCGILSATATEAGWEVFMTPSRCTGELYMHLEVHYKHAWWCVLLGDRSQLYTRLIQHSQHSSCSSSAERYISSAETEQLLCYERRFFVHCITLHLETICSQPGEV
jgi:hypothetical protein